MNNYATQFLIYLIVSHLSHNPKHKLIDMSCFLSFFFVVTVNQTKVQANFSITFDNVIEEWYKIVGCGLCCSPSSQVDIVHKLCFVHDPNNIANDNTIKVGHQVNGKLTGHLGDQVAAFIVETINC